jgi:hypothetical protein
MLLKFESKCPACRAGHGRQWAPAPVPPRTGLAGNTATAASASRMPITANTPLKPGRHFLISNGNKLKNRLFSQDLRQPDPAMRSYSAQQAIISPTGSHS